MADTPTVQRSFRLSPRTSELLDEAALRANESRNALADRLLGEAVRLERHPLIRFRSDAVGRRVAHLTGTRLDVHQVIATLRANGADTDATADYLAVAPALVRAAVAFYAEFRDEVDAAADAAASVALEERERWERERRALG
jgi:uncharacterized protein (DUF433 family)